VKSLAIFPLALALFLSFLGATALGAENEPAYSAEQYSLDKDRYAKFPLPLSEYDEVEEWMGYRPSTPDSLPMIGQMGASGIYAAFGHQHIGLTGGPKTGRWVADMIGGRSNADLEAFGANRFT
jgi:D-amino-acid dehydrogenase